MVLGRTLYGATAAVREVNRCDEPGVLPPEWGIRVQVFLQNVRGLSIPESTVAFEKMTRTTRHFASSSLRPPCFGSFRFSRPRSPSRLPVSETPSAYGQNQLRAVFLWR